MIIKFLDASGFAYLIRGVIKLTGILLKNGGCHLKDMTGFMRKDYVAMNVHFKAGFMFFKQVSECQE